MPAKKYNSKFSAYQKYVMKMDGGKSSKKIQKLVRDVKQLKRVETTDIQYDDFASTASPVGGTGVITYLNPQVSEGFATGRYSDGNTLQGVYKGFEYNCRYYASRSASGNGMYRCIIFRDMANKQALPAITDYLVSASTLSKKNPLNLKRFKTLYDKTKAINLSADIAGANGGMVTFHYKKLWKTGITAEYVAEGANVADCQIGQIFCILIHDSFGASTGSAVFQSRNVYIPN